jgi:drug/metabolite transporter (DMT)-like permease
MVAVISYQLQDLNTTENPWSIVFWFAAITTPVAALALPFVWTTHDPLTWALILSMGLVGAAAQMLLTTSLRFGSAAVILLMDYTALLWASYYGYAIFGRSAPASLWAGAPLIIGAGLLIAWRERQLARSRVHSAE